MKYFFTFIMLCFLAGVASAQTNIFCPENQNCTVTGNWSFAGQLNPKLLGAEEYASAFPGTDCGLKIAAAIAALPSNGGVIRINRACDGGSTATTPWSTFIVPTHVYLSCIEPGTYWTSQINFGTAVSAANNSGLYGIPSSAVYATTDGACIFEQGNNVNANPYIQGQASDVEIRDMVIDGNGANNPTSGPVVEIFGSSNKIFSSTIRNGHSHCVQLGNGQASPIKGAITIVSDSMLNNCTGSSLFLNFVTDVWVRGNNLDNSTRWGLECIGCGGIRVNHNDIGGGGLGGSLFSGVASFSTGGITFSNNVSKNNNGPDLDLESPGGGTALCFGFSITTNFFGGLLTTAAANTYPAIKSNGCGGSVISTNVFTKPSTSPTYSRAVLITEPTAGQEIEDIVTENNCFITPGAGTPVGGTSCYSSTTQIETYLDHNIDTTTQFIGLNSGFGSGASIPFQKSSNGRIVFTLNVGTGGSASSGFVNMPISTNGWICKVNDITAVAANKTYNTVQIGSGTNAISVQNQTVSTGAAIAWTASDILQFDCGSY
jgi:hypothetical protein